MFQQVVEDEVMRRRKQTLLVFAVVIVALYGLDLVILQRLSLAPLGIRVLWSLALVGTTLVIAHLRPPYARVLSASYGVVATVCFTGLILLTGHTESPYFYFFPSLPLIIAMVSVTYLEAAFTSGVLSALSGGWLLHQSGEPVMQGVMWAAMVVCIMFFGMYGGVQFQKAQHLEDEMRLERTRREALEKLAMSERRRTQSEKLATIGRLAASVAHELNNPIAYVQSNAGFLEREVLSQPVKSKEELREAFQDVSSGLERIRQIVSDLQGFSRMDAAEVPTECSLAEVVKDATRLASVRLKHVARLKVEVPLELPGVYVVRRKLAQVILNLLVNAGDALESRGGVDGEVRVSGRVEDSSVLLLVEDNGPGFPPEVLGRLFEAFFTTKGPEKGTGLGLSLSREFVEQFGGTLIAENRPEGGARLRIGFPARVCGELVARGMSEAVAAA
ncbi:sensor histidine kinase [Hyalangium rubrum]|uniref:histidine kinase n=1 Tax=Hyalangium rubrum TaxID=3103134 RepID=A0ABU5H450_9BACT|nr:ATP-binding protein [Hyalangium sp. s54d21]MDY7228086.1 ATP-binding protein [Hyalangium sp. s54d21]